MLNLVVACSPLLKNMYRKFGIDWDKRGQDKRVHGKPSKKAPKKSTFSCDKQCGRVFATAHRRRLHEECCKHQRGNTTQEDDVPEVSILKNKPHSSGKRPTNAPYTAAHKKQCRTENANRPELHDVQVAIMDPALQPTLDEDTLTNAATEARTLLDEHGWQRLEQKSKQCVRANDASPS